MHRMLCTKSVIFYRLYEVDACPMVAWQSLARWICKVGTSLVVHRRCSCLFVIIAIDSIDMTLFFLQRQRAGPRLTTWQTLIA